MDIVKELAASLNLEANKIEKTVALIDEGNTIPFISRYRKEITGNMSDEMLRDLYERLTYLRSLSQRQEEICRLIDEQGAMTPQLKEEIFNTKKLQELEDIYLPYRPKRRTRATIAKEAGAQPLADALLSSSEESAMMAQELAQKNKITLEEAYGLAVDILAEHFSEMSEIRSIARFALQKSQLEVKADAEKDPEGVYRHYYEFKSCVDQLKPYQILALFRGEKQNVLKLSFHLDDDYTRFKMERKLGVKGNEWIAKALADAYKRLILPTIETEVRQALKEMADDESIKVFRANLKPYLMQRPLKDKVVLGIDPGFRTGCKVAVITAHGDFLDHNVIYPTEPKKNIEGAKKIILSLIDQYHVDIIVIGNGTASRETEQFVSDLIKDENLKGISYAIVNEAGASIYSASELAREEFPDLDVTVRGAISIARRAQDPMAELVKIEPQHIGVGQYQHDVNQKKLKESLSHVIEDAVNGVGVNVNTASVALLSYVSGLNKKTAENIITYRRENGSFKNRMEIGKVKGIGPKSFTQCAGFLRIPGAENILDNTAVHPESYAVAEKILNVDLDTIDISELAYELQVGELTLKDIIGELKKPGRDPRDNMPEITLKKDVLSIEDLEEGMVMYGTVRNVVDFGAFVDIGLKNDALLHKSDMNQKRLTHPSELLKVQDIVEVKVIRIDRERGRVNLQYIKKK